MQGDKPLAPLRDEQFVVLSTFRASGEPVPTTVWFADAGDTIYITTNARLKKVGRIRANPRVLLAPSDRVGNIHGPEIAARARVLDPTEFDRAADVGQPFPKADQTEAASRTGHGRGVDIDTDIARLAVGHQRRVQR